MSVTATHLKLARRFKPRLQRIARRRGESPQRFLAKVRGRNARRPKAIQWRL